MESRIRLVATAISAILIVTACNTAASPSAECPVARSVRSGGHPPRRQADRRPPADSSSQASPSTC